MCVLCLHCACVFFVCCGMVVSLAGGCLIHSGPCSWWVSIFEVLLDASICWHPGSRPPTLKHKFSNLFHLQILRFLADVWLNITAFPNKVCSGKSVFVLVTRCSPLVQKNHCYHSATFLEMSQMYVACMAFCLCARWTAWKHTTLWCFFFWDVSTHIGGRGNFELARNHLKILVGAQKCMYEFKQFHKQNAPSKKESTWNFRSFS